MNDPRARSAAPVPGAHPTSDNYAAFPPGMQRFAAASGILFVLLLIISILVNSATLPDADAAPEEFLRFVTDEKDAIELGTLFTALAAIEWIWFVGVVTAALARAETAVRGFARVSWVVLGGGLVAVSMVLVATVLMAATATTPQDTEPSVVRALAHANFAAFAMASVGFAAMLGAAAIVVLRAGGLPKWLGWLGLAGSLFYTLTLFTVLMPEDDGGAFEIFWPLSLLAFVIWVVAASVSLIRQVGRDASTTTTAPPPPATPAV